MQIDFGTYNAETLANLRSKKNRIAWRQLICEEAGTTCFWCKQFVNKQYGFMNSATIEHVVPRSLGGTDARWNLSLACYRCNNQRGVLDAETFSVISSKYKPDTRTVEEAAKENRKVSRKQYKARKRARELVSTDKAVFDFFSKVFKQINNLRTIKV